VLIGVLDLRGCIFLQVIQCEYHSTLSENNRVHVQPIPPTRGFDLRSQWRGGGG
jgi:hypothetical protein